MVDTAAPMAMGVEAGPPDAKRMRIAEGTAGGFDVNGGRLPVPSLADGLEPIGEEVEEDTDSEEASNKKFQDYKCKPRRKATQKPVVGSVGIVCIYRHAERCQLAIKFNETHRRVLIKKGKHFLSGSVELC